VDRRELSLDTLDRAALTGSLADRFHEVIAGRFRPRSRSTSFDARLQRRRRCRRAGGENGYQVRFIEWMPPDYQHGWSRGNWFRGLNLAAIRRFPPSCSGNDPAPPTLIAIATAVAR
jgi:hypothetical protein